LLNFEKAVCVISAFIFLFSDYNEFLEDLEEDPTMRQNINIFKDSARPVPVDSGDIDDDEAPRITLEEMLDDLVIGDEVEMD
jgi:nonsense-mediated mRNA decay protein 3